MASSPIRSTEFNKLFLCAQNAKDYELCKIYTMLYYFGFRICEVLQFSPQDIQTAVSSGWLKIYSSKTKTSREMPLSKTCASLLSLLIARSHSLEHFIKPLCKDHLTAKANSHIKAVLGAGYTSHGFRRGLVTDLLLNDKNDIAAKEVAAIIGHKSVATTAKYYEVLSEAKIKRVFAVR